MTAPRRLARPRPTVVELRPDGLPASVDRVGVDSVREDWLVEDRWWTARPTRRRYVELVLETGRCVVVFRDRESGRWFSQRA
jgi:hypothetical protein